MDKEEAIKYSKAGATAAFISGSLTTAVVLYAMLTNAKGALGLWNDPSNFIDILLILSCAIGMLRYSRAAAITIFVYFILSKVLIGLETGGMPSLGIALLFLYYFGRAILGIFVYHKIQKEQDPNYRSAPKWMYYVGIPSGLLALMIMGYGILAETGVVPSVKVTSGSNMRQEDRSLLIEKGIVQVDAGSAVALNEHMSITQVSKDTYVKEFRSHLINAADVQKSYFAKNASYMSCAACTARNLPGYNDNPNVTLVAEVGKTDFVLVATHMGCGDDIWTYQNSTGTIAEPNTGCNNAPSY